ncbi:unnamed protein product, partial [Protopolystoma xenopodis]
KDSEGQLRKLFFVDPKQGCQKSSISKDVVTAEPVTLEIADASLSGDILAQFQQMNIAVPTDAKPFCELDATVSMPLTTAATDLGNFSICSSHEYLFLMLSC